MSFSIAPVRVNGLFAALVVTAAVSTCPTSSRPLLVALESVPDTPLPAQPAQLEEPRPWWETIEFAPAGRTVNGLPVSSVVASWTDATVLTRELMPAVTDEVTAEVLRDKDTGFALDGDFDGNGIADRAAVGVYRDRAGVSGRFLIIVSPAAHARPRITYLATAEGAPGFSVLRRVGKRLLWADCLACDVFAEVVYERGRFSLR